MIHSRVGVDLGGEVARIVFVQAGAAGEIITLRTAPMGVWRSAIDSDTAWVTIAIDDRLSNVRIVRPAFVDPALARDAAEYEARIAMLGQDSDLLIDVIHIGNANDPRAWLAVSTHAGAMATVDTTHANPTESVAARYLPRSVALGWGYLFGCESRAKGLVVLIEIGQATSSICFVDDRAVIGTAYFKGLSPTANDADLTTWYAELQMIVRYRLSSDLSDMHDSGVPALVWIGEPSLGEKLSSISGTQISPAKLRSVDISPESDVPALTTDWLAALGAARN